MFFVGKEKCDLSDPALIDFVQKHKIGEFINLTVEQPGYHDSGTAPIVLGATPPSASLFVVWSVTQRFHIFDHHMAPGGQLIQKVDLQTFATRSISIEGKISLLVRDGISSEIEKKIRTAFESYVFPTSGDVDAFVAKCLTDEPSVGPYDFGLSKFFTVKIIGDRIVDSVAYDAMMHPLIRAERYRVIMVSDQDHATYHEPPQNPNQVPVKDIPKTAESRMSGRCDGLETQVNRIARADWVPASRVTWVWEVVNWGCVKFHFWKPITELRNQELIAYLSITYPMNIGQYAVDQVVASANEAATASVVALIIFSDLTTAIATFNGIFYRSLEQKFGRAIECIGADLWVDTVPVGDWH